VAQALTPSLDLGTAFYQIRASNFVLMTRTFLLAQDPVPPPHGRARRFWRRSPPRPPGG